MRASFLSTVLAATCAGSAWAQTPDALYAQGLAASCTQCHGTQGRAAIGSSVPAIAGMPRDYLAEQLRAFKAGTRPATVMHQLAKGYNDAQIDQLASYFAAQKK
jgi:cytochrome c553